MAWCLPPAEVDAFKKALLNGEIDPVKLAAMTSAERRAFFSKRFGEAMAGPMNVALEGKLLLKNQQKGMISWAKQMMANNKPAQDRMMAKIEKLGAALDPKQQDAFMEDLVAEKLGTRVTAEEAKTITELAAKVTETKRAMEAAPRRTIGHIPTPEELAYGDAAVALRNYIQTLSTKNASMSAADFKENPGQATATFAKRAIMGIGGNSKAIISSMDNSALLRQGMPTLLTHPTIWQRNARQSFVDIVKAFGSDQVLNNVMAEIISRPTYDLMRRAGLDVGIREEAYPESLPEKIPGIGRAFRASEAAYRGFLSRTRADLFDLYLRTYIKSGMPLDNTALKGIGTLANTMTGRGNLRGLESSAQALNSLFFSPRNMASKVHMLTAHLFDPTATRFTKQQAGINLAKMLGGFAVMLLLAKAVLGKKAADINSMNPTFGKISHKTKTHADVLLGAIADALGVTVNTYKHGDTTYDVTGGMASYITLASRIANRLANWSKERMGFRVPKEKRNTWRDAENFFENKAAPVGGAIKSIMQDRTFEGEKPTIGGIIKDLVVPLPAQNIVELEQERKLNERRYTTPFGRQSNSR